MHSSILFDLGIILFLGFFAALLMKKLNQSAIIGYILVGLLIGPNTLGLIKDKHTLDNLSELGIVFLMFFLGIEFSLNKFKKIKNSVFFICTSELVANYALGLSLGLILGYAVKENLFFAAIVTLSSSGVAAKLLFEMKKTATKESEVLMGVAVFEDFIAVVLLGIVSSFAAFDKIQFSLITFSVLKSLVFYCIFILIGVFIINKFIDMLTRIESQEMFTTLMIGLILLIGALATYIGLASAAGAFLLGMVIISYDVEERLHKTVAGFKDIFITVFFVSFGMLLDPRQIPGILWMVALVLPLSILTEIVSTTSSAFLCGFSSKSAAFIGSSMVARGEYALIFASLGYSTGAISDSMYQFTGTYMFLMTILAPVILKNHKVVEGTFKIVLPRFIKYSMKLISITLKPILLPEETNIRVVRRYKFITCFAFYLSTIIVAFIIKNIYVLVGLSLLGLALVFIMRRIFINRVHALEEQLDYNELHKGEYSFNRIAEFISSIFAALLVIILLGAAFWNFGYFVLVSLIIMFVLYLISVSIYVYKKAF